MNTNGPLKFFGIYLDFFPSKNDPPNIFFPLIEIYGFNFLGTRGRNFGFNLLPIHSKFKYSFNWLGRENKRLIVCVKLFSVWLDFKVKGKNELL